MLAPNSVQFLVDAELSQLRTGEHGSLTPDARLAIYAALGRSLHSGKRKQLRGKASLPTLSVADRVRTRLELIVGRKLEVLWPQACRETDANYNESPDAAEVRQEEESYLAERQSKPVEHISIYSVPRAFIPSHILEMAELVMSGGVQDRAAFRYETNECWQIYGRPERQERECFIKWAAQDALYEAIGWGRRDHPPAHYAIYAFAGMFEGDGFDRRCTFDAAKQLEFWTWWLSEAIPQAIRAES
jgi:hypothetical protein